MNEFIALLSFWQFIFRLLFSSFAFCSLGCLLYRHAQLNDKLISDPLRINIAAWICTAFFDLLYVSSSLLSRSFAKVPSDLIFWTGAPYFAATTGVNVSVFFLLLDRCCILLSPSFVDAATKRRVTIVNACLVIGQFAFFLAIFVQFERPPSFETECETFSCISVRHAATLTLTRSIYGTVNLIAALVFFVLLFRYNKRRSSLAQTTPVLRQSIVGGPQIVAFQARGNFVAGVAVASQLLFNFLPNLSAYVVSQLLQAPISEFAGPIVSTCSQLDAVCSTLVYLRVLGRRVWRAKGTEST